MAYATSAMNDHDAERFALELAPLTAAVANFCDHVEHNEIAERSWVLDSATELRMPHRRGV